MRTAYKKSPIEIVKVLRALAESEDIRFESPKRLDAEISSYNTGKCDFADYIIRERAIEAGCDKIATFDKALLKEPGFVEP